MYTSYVTCDLLRQITPYTCRQMYGVFKRVIGTDRLQGGVFPEAAISLSPLSLSSHGMAHFRQLALTLSSLPSQIIPDPTENTIGGEPAKPGRTLPLPWTPPAW